MSSPNEQRAAHGGRPFLWLGSLAAVAVALAILLSRKEPQRDVLIITIDTLRADALVEEDMPALLDAARRGTRYLRARTVAPLTLPAHATLLTGVLPPAHGIRDNTAAPLPDPKARPFPLLAEEFRDAGYATAAFVASGVLDRRYRLDQGFGTYRQPPAPAPGTPSFPELGAKEQVARVREWMAAREKDKPFFVWVHLWDPHAYYSAYEGDERRAGTDDRDPDALRYRGEVRRADAAVEALLALVDPERTIVVVAADHGESLGEHGEATHAQLCYGATMDVPLVLVGPGVPSGRSEERVAGLEDVAPTLRKLCGLEVRRCDGFDLLKLPEERIAVGESLAANRLYGWAQQSVAYDGRFSLVDGGPRLELFDRGQDPGEKQPLLDPASRQEYERLDRALESYRNRRGPAGEGDEIPAAPTYYGIPLLPQRGFSPVATNRGLRDVRDALPDAKLVEQANGAIAARQRQLVEALVPRLLELEQRDPGNPAASLARGRALLLVLGDAPGAVAALEEAVRRGYVSPDVDRLLEAAAEAAHDAEALGRVRERREKKPR